MSYIHVVNLDISIIDFGEKHAWKDLGEHVYLLVLPADIASRERLGRPSDRVIAPSHRMVA